MKKIMYMAVAAIAVLSSCSSEEFTQSSNGINGEANVFTGTTENDGVSSRSTLDATSKRSYWETSDIVSINGVKYSPTTGGASTTTFGKAEGETAAAPDKPYYAFFANGANTGTGSFESTNHTFTLPATYNCVTDESGNPKFNMPMYAYCADKNETSGKVEFAFKNLCGVLALTVPSTQFTTVKTIKVSSNLQLNGAFTSTDAGALTFSGTAAEGNKTVTLDCGTDGVAISDSKTFYLPIAPGTHYPLTITVSDGTTTKIMKTTNQNGIAITRNAIYSLTFAESYTTFSGMTDINLLPGEFSVSTTKKVYFTRGNLYWNGTAYHIEPNQAGCPSTLASHQNNHMAKFTFITASDYSSKKPYTIGTYSASNTNANNFCFAENNTIVNTIDGVNGSYYDLSGDEWQYLLATRTVNGSTGAGHTYQVINLTLSDNTTRYGAVIVPDGYTTSLPTAKSTVSWSDWKTMESNGCVFLPATGRIEGTVLQTYNEEIPYRTSTMFYSSSSDCGAYGVWGYKDSTSLDGKNKFYSNLNSYPVRLVKTKQ